MSALVPQLDLEIVQGATFSHILMWCSDVLVQKTITAIVKGAPTLVTATSHGMPSGLACWIEEVGGMRQIKNDHLKDLPYFGAAVNVNTVSVPVNSHQFNAFTSGGALVYYQPQDMANFTARMQIRDSVSASAFLLELTTSNSRIALDNTAKTITLTIAAADTDDISWTRGVYDLEMVSQTGIVTRILQGNVFVNREVTR